MNDPSRNDEERLARLVREAGDPSVTPDPKYAEKLHATILDRLESAETESAIVKPGTSSITSEEPCRPLVCAQTEGDPESSYPNFLTRSLDNWRYIMRSPVSRAAAVAIFVFALVGTVLWFQGVGATPAFADVAQQILEMKSAKYLETHTTENVSNDRKPRLDVMGGGQAEVLWSAPNRYRREDKVDDKNKTVAIMDHEKQKSIFMEPGEKFAIVTRYCNNQELGVIEKIRKLLRKEKKDTRVESLGEKVIDGHRVIGYRIKEEIKDDGSYLERFPSKTDIWADSKMLWPVYIEKSVILSNGVVIVLARQNELKVSFDRIVVHEH